MLTALRSGAGAVPRNRKALLMFQRKCHRPPDPPLDARRSRRQTRNNVLRNYAWAGRQTERPWRIVFSVTTRGSVKCSR